MGEVQGERQTLVITKRGKPVSKLVPADQSSDDIYDFLAGTSTVVDQIFSIVFTYVVDL